MSVAKEFPLLAQVYIASPCSADWEQMTGDERVRFCGACQKRVFNLSEMTAPEAEALIVEHEGKFCGRFYQRADGSVLTADCPVGWAAVRARLRRATYRALALATACCLATLQAFGLSRFADDGDGLGSLRELHLKLTLSARSPGAISAFSAVAGGICIPANPIPIIDEPPVDAPAESEIILLPTEGLQLEQVPDTNE